MENIEPPSGSASDANNAADGKPEVPYQPPRSFGLLGNMVSPITRTGGFWARSWADYLDRQPGELPVARPTVALARQAFRDELVLAGRRMFRPISDPREFARIDHEVIAACELYDEAGWLDDPESYFAAPPPLTEVSIRTVETRQRTYERIRFDSGYEPPAGDPGRERWLGYTANTRVRAWMLRHEEPRPWLVCVHGAEMGRPGLDLALFRAGQLHHDFGLNVVFPVLPLHGPRRHELPKSAVFPGEDMLDNVHAATQAVWDIRRLLSWIRSQEGDMPIGFNSISLGGYVTSLVASLEDGLACAILGVPAADLRDLLERHAGLAHNDPRRHTVALAAPLYRMVSPLALTPRVAYEGRFIYAGVADRLVHPREQVTRLWEHWGRPEIVWYKGGHTGFFRSRSVQAFVQGALVQSGLVDASRAPRRTR